jgi:hypothetical protein
MPYTDSSRYSQCSGPAWTHTASSPQLLTPYSSVAHCLKCGERVICVPAHPDRDVFKMRHEQRAGPARHEGQALPFGERESGT